VEVTITGLYHYPVKSCAGVGLAQCSISAKGISGDREWVILNKDGVFLSQRKNPRLGLIRIRRDGKRFNLYFNDADKAIAPCPVTLPDIEDARTQIIHIWRDEATAFIADTAVNEWVTNALDSDEPLFLGYFDKRVPRLPGYPDRFGADATHFADAAPFLVANALSLYALNLSLSLQHLPEVDIRHFRPNIVFSGLPGFAEHHVKALRHNASGFEFSLIDPCQRCSIITLNPDTSERLPNAVPFKQLTAINPMPGSNKAPAFGMNAILEGGTEKARARGLQLGDRLEVIQ